MMTTSGPDASSDSGASRRVAFEIRPGVRFPRWDRIRSDAAEAALITIFGAVGVERRWVGYGEAQDRVRTAILRGFAATARAPSAARLAEACALAPDELTAVLRELKDRDLIVLDRSGDTVTGAYPFTQSDTGHVVRVNGVALFAMCAVDALGIGAMLGQDTKIESRCGGCGAPVRVETGEGGLSLTSHAPDGAVVWVGDLYAGGCGATSLCQTILFFCADDHLRAWRQAGRSDQDGCRLSVAEAHQVGTAVFGPMLTSSIPKSGSVKGDCDDQ